jgi:hypothetical protein
MRKLILFLFLLIPVISFSQNNLYIIDPHGWWWEKSPATIDSAEITVKPIGAYIEYSLCLSFSATEPGYFNYNSQLEVIMNFELPTNSMITDSWLWIYGIPKQAEIMDRWTATNIYEYIVNRRKDPSLLVKNGNNQYAINIYPMLPTESRVIKINYLSPANYTNGQLDVEIPLNILKLTSKPIAKTAVWVIPSAYHSQVLSGNSNINFEPAHHNEFGASLKAEIQYDDLLVHDIKLGKNNAEKIELTRYGTETDGVYQLSFIPSDWIDYDKARKKICYLVDFDANYYSYKSDVVIETIKKSIKSSLSENDHFNVIFSNLNLDQAFTGWMAATTENIDEAFSNPKLTSYSNHPQLIAKGISFINEQGGIGKIALITNSSDFKDYQKANEMIKDISALNTQRISINIIDYGNTNIQNYWINGQYYLGNSYFFSNLTRTNSGEYFQIASKGSAGQEQLFAAALNDVTGDVILNMDIYTKCNNGFTYARSTISTGLNNSFNVGRVVHQIGKYKGGLPSLVEVSFEMNKEVFHSLINLDAQKFITGDSLTHMIWQGLDMMQLEAQQQSNQVVSEIIYQSIENRILSKYTAFLCIEDSVDLSEMTENQGDNGEVIVSNNEFNSSKNNLKVYPSVFTDKVTIELNTSEQLQSVKVYNTLGQCVKSLSLTNENQLIWDGTDENGKAINKGIYLIVATFANHSFTARVIKQ